MAFEYLFYEKNGSNVSGIGDEAAICQTGDYLARISNAVVQIVGSGEDDVGRIIAEKIVEKAENE